MTGLLPCLHLICWGSTTVPFEIRLCWHLMDTLSASSAVARNMYTINVPSATFFKIQTQREKEDRLKLLILGKSMTVSLDPGSTRPIPVVKAYLPLHWWLWQRWKPHDPVWIPQELTRNQTIVPSFCHLWLCTCWSPGGN